MFYAWLLGSAIIGYFLGSLPFGAMVARAHGVDIFKEGSGNPGATNVKRVLGEKFGAKGKRAGNLVFGLDVLKGAIASAWSLLSWTSLSVTVDMQTGSGAEVINGQDWRLLGLAGVIGAILGHSFSIFTGFKGGKGVATAAGVLLALDPLLGLAVAGTWLFMAFAFRYSSLAAVTAAFMAPVISVLMHGGNGQTLVVGILGMALIGKHWPNIQRLLAGQESKIGSKKKP